MTTTGTTEGDKLSDEEFRLMYEEAFIDINPVHTLVQEHTGKIIKIHEMSHVAPASFYEKKNREIKEDYDAGMEIHQEGVNMKRSAQKPRRTPLGDSYKKVAELLGMTAQAAPAVPHKVNDISDQTMSRAEKVQMKAFLGVAETLSDKLARAIENQQDREKIIEKVQITVLMQHFDMMAGKGFPNTVLFKLFDALVLNRRNEHAAAAALSTPKDVSLVWGKAHAPGLIDLFERSGYVLTSDTRWKDVVRRLEEDDEKTETTGEIVDAVDDRAENTNQDEGQ